MITDSFDDESEAKINPKQNAGKTKCDICIITFSNIIEEYVLNKYKCIEVGKFNNVTGPISIYTFYYKDKTIAFYKTYLGAPAMVGCFESVLGIIDCDDFIVFGGAGCLDKNIAHGKVMIPTYAYRDEGTSYHYEKPGDYIKIQNSDIVKEFMELFKIPYVEGKNWTTDAFYRETENNIKKRKGDGCISVDMECSAMQAVCNHRNKRLYYFLTSGDLLDAPEWDERKAEGEIKGTQHDTFHFEIAFKLAVYIASKNSI